MLTPQEVSEHAFVKAGFGGYNMAMVDEFLDTLTEDYTTLYKDSAVLKSKMKVLVDKVEEYRATEDAMRKALLTAQKMADEIVQEAERKQAEMVAEAEEEARRRVAGMRQEADAEQYRLTTAQAATADYVAKMKALCAQELDYLDHLNQMHAPPPKAPDPVQTATEDIEASIQRIITEAVQNTAPPVEPPPAQPEPASVSAASVPTVSAHATTNATTQTEERPGGLYDDISAYAQSKGGMAEKHIAVTLGQKPAEPHRPAPPAGVDEPTQRIDFDHLQFGRDFEIK